MRLPLSVLDSDPETFIKGMEERGFVVLTDLGSGEEVARLQRPPWPRSCLIPICSTRKGSSACPERGVLKQVYAEAMTEFRALCAEDDASKARATSRKVYRNERGYESSPKTALHQHSTRLPEPAFAGVQHAVSGTCRSGKHAGAPPRTSGERERLLFSEAGIST